MTELGLDDEAVYDCYVHHYHDYFWTELEEVEQRALESLGWNVSSWEGFIPAPPSEDKFYAQLDSEEQEAAAELCYLPETWDEVGIQFWTIDYETLAYYETMEIDILENATLNKIKSVGEEDFDSNQKEIEVEEAESSAFSLGLTQWVIVLATLTAFIAIY